MGVVLMSKRELNRIDILARLEGGRLTIAAAADLMRLTQRQIHRLLKRYRDGGAPAIANRRRGRPSNNRKHPPKAAETLVRALCPPCNDVWTTYFPRLTAG